MNLDMIDKDPWESLLIPASFQGGSSSARPRAASDSSTTVMRSDSRPEVAQGKEHSGRGRARLAAVDGQTLSAPSGTPRDASSADHSGGDNPYGLTATEFAILELLTEGLSNLGIAKRRGIQEGTVKIHLSAIYRKLGVQSRTQAARIAERLGAIRQVQVGRASEPGAVLDWLLPYVTCESRRAGEVLFRRGERGNCLYFVQRGRIQLSEIRTDVGDGELIGEVGVFSPSNVRTCTARCETDVRLFRLSAEQARRLYFENPQLAYRMIQLIAERLSQDRCTPAADRPTAAGQADVDRCRAQLGG